jgi:hypothetical protein
MNRDELCEKIKWGGGGGRVMGEHDYRLPYTFSLYTTWPKSGVTRDSIQHTYISTLQHYLLTVTEKEIGGYTYSDFDARKGSRNQRCLQADGTAANKLTQPLAEPLSGLPSPPFSLSHLLPTHG